MGWDRGGCLPVGLLLLMVCMCARAAGAVCEPIRIEMCRGLGYNVTAMPNLVGHEIQGDADFTLQTFSPLIQYGCSAQLHLFLCSVYAPMCTEKVPSPIGPCRGLCEQVRARCYPVLQGFGFPWPAALNCSKFPPENNHQHMCMEGPGEPGPANPVQAVGAGNGPWGCSWYAKSGLYIFLNRSGRCAAACDADVVWSQKDKKLTEAWTAAFVTVSLISILVAILTILRPRKQPISTAERAIGCLTLCHAAVAAGYAVRLAAGRGAVACAATPPPTSPEHPQEAQLYLTQDGLANPYCATVFLLVYYFGNAASVWWVVVCGWWCLIARRWSRQPREEAGGLQQGLSTVGAVTAWGIPAAFTIAVLVTRDVDADELTGNCYVGQQSTRSLLLLVLIPQLVYQALGMLFLLIGIISLLIPPPAVTQPVLNPLQRQRETGKSPDSQRRQKELITRIGIFAWLYALAALCSTSGTLYEWWGREGWLRAPEPSSTPKAGSRPLVQLFVLRIVASLTAGILASSWIWWPGLMNVWRRLPPCKQPPHKCPPQMPVVHCYGGGSTSPAPQIHHLGHLSGVQHPLLQQHIGVSPQIRSHKKKHRKHRQYHSGSETQV